MGEPLTPTTEAMEYGEFLDRVINDGIAAVRVDYANSEAKLQGAIQGFEECRGLQPPDLLELLGKANDLASEAYLDARNYWRWRCRAAEVEWVCNVVSAVMMSNGQHPIITPTARGVMKAAEILGVAE